MLNYPEMLTATEIFVFHVNVGTNRIQLKFSILYITFVRCNRKKRIFYFKHEAVLSFYLEVFENSASS